MAPGFFQCPPLLVLVLLVFNCNLNHTVPVEYSLIWIHKIKDVSGFRRVRFPEGAATQQCGCDQSQETPVSGGRLRHCQPRAIHEGND